jgi:transaldolase
MAALPPGRVQDLGIDVWLKQLLFPDRKSQYETFHCIPMRALLGSTSLGCSSKLQYGLPVFDRASVYGQTKNRSARTACCGHSNARISNSGIRTITMDFFADTADVSELRILAALGLLDGVTTNPSLIARSGRKHHDVIAEICTVTQGPVSAEVVATATEAMVAEGQALAAIAPNVVVKVPLTEDGLTACRAFSALGIKVNVTLCFSLVQAIVAAKAGATFISPFVGRLDDINLDGMQLIRDIREAYDVQHYTTKILAASMRSANHVGEAARAGADAVTAPAAVLRGLTRHPLTDAGLAKFMADWTAAQA